MFANHVYEYYVMQGIICKSIINCIKLYEIKKHTIGKKAEKKSIDTFSKR